MFEYINNKFLDKVMATATTKGISVAILIFILLIIIIYVIVLFELYKQKRSIFSTYTPPTPPSPFFYPLGNVRPMSQEEIDRRNAIIRASS